MHLPYKLKNCFLIFGLFIPYAYSATDIVVKATVLGPACTINNGNVIEVNFGNDILANKINGDNYQQSFTLNFSCTTQTPNNVFITIEGYPWDYYNPIHLPTSKENLFVIFKHGNKTLPINEKIQVDRRNSQTILAIPTRYDKDDRIKPGPFNVATTLKVSYE